MVVEGRISALQFLTVKLCFVGTAQNIHEFESAPFGLRLNTYLCTTILIVFSAKVLPLAPIYPLITLQTVINSWQLILLIGVCNAKPAKNPYIGFCNTKLPSALFWRCPAPLQRERVW